MSDGDRTSKEKRATISKGEVRQQGIVGTNGSHLEGQKKQKGHPVGRTFAGTSAKDGCDQGEVSGGYTCGADPLTHPPQSSFQK